MPCFLCRGSAARATTTLATLALLASLASLALVACGGGDSGAHPPPLGAPRRPDGSFSVRPPAPPTSTVVDTGPAMQGTHAVIRPEAVGPLHVGAWRRAAMSFVYAMTAFSAPGETEIIPVHGVGNDTVTVVIVNDTVSQIQVMRPGAHTLEGVQVGTPLATVRAMRGATVGHDGAATTVTLPHECGIVFSTADSSAHSGVPKGKAPLPFAPDSAVIRTIIVGKCTGS